MRESYRTTGGVVLDANSESVFQMAKCMAK